VSSDFTYAIIGDSVVLAPAPQICPTYQWRYIVDIGFSLLADNESDEEAPTGWVPELNRHQG
jgi:hypothetical protein